jgi:hypothetical protein
MSGRFKVETAANMASLHDSERHGSADRVALFFGVPDQPRGAQRYAELCADYLNHLDKKRKEAANERDQQI